MRFERVHAVCVAALVGLGLVPSPAQAAARPDPLAAEAGCVRYRGVPTGANDSTQQFEVKLCSGPDGVHAKVQSSSLVSGWSVRESEGSWDAAGRVVTLADTKFLEYRPEPSWRFCLIDELVLEKTARGLEGRYRSEACKDTAELVLTKLDDGDGVGPNTAPTPESTPPPEPTPVQKPVPPAAKPESSPDPAPTSGCSCRTSATGDPGPTGGVGLVVLGLGLLGRLTRGRGRSRSRPRA